MFTFTTVTISNVNRISNTIKFKWDTEVLALPHVVMNLDLSD